MAKPNQYVCVGIEPMEVCFNEGNRVYRYLPGSFIEKKTPKYGEHIDTLSQIWGVLDVLEAPVFIIWRTFDPLQPLPPWCLAERRLPCKYNDHCGEYRTDDQNV